MQAKKSSLPSPSSMAMSDFMTAMNSAARLRYGKRASSKVARGNRAYSGSRSAEYLVPAASSSQYQLELPIAQLVGDGGSGELPYARLRGLGGGRNRYTKFVWKFIKFYFIFKIKSYFILKSFIIYKGMFFNRWATVKRYVVEQNPVQNSFIPSGLIDSLNGAERLRWDLITFELIMLFIWTVSDSVENDGFFQFTNSFLDL